MAAATIADAESAWHVLRAMHYLMVVHCHECTEAHGKGADDWYEEDTTPDACFCLGEMRCAKYRRLMSNKRSITRQRAVLNHRSGLRPLRMPGDPPRVVSD